MLRKFRVEGYKGFRDPVEFNLSAHKYDFNERIVKGGVVKNATIYGKNGIGKSSLGSALFDIVMHLTDTKPMGDRYLVNYLNLDEVNKNFASFSYEFVFDDHVVVYSYQKTAPTEMKWEELTVNGKLVVRYDFNDKKSLEVDSGVVGNLNVELPDNHLSVVKYLYRNLNKTAIPALTKLVQFCEGMLWYRSLSDGNTYAGFTNGTRDIFEVICSSNKLKDFQRFLLSNDLKYDLEARSVNGNLELYAKFANGKRAVPFNSVASTGTKALSLFYFWRIFAAGRMSFLFIDEFDAFFHYEAAEVVVGSLNNEEGFQTILTSHNTYLMNNRLTRPDCCFIMTKNKISCLCDCTDREIREAHNLEKMYVTGAFCE